MTDDSRLILADWLRDVARRAKSQSEGQASTLLLIDVDLINKSSTEFDRMVDEIRKEKRGE